MFDARDKKHTNSKRYKIAAGAMAQQCTKQPTGHPAPSCTASTTAPATRATIGSSTRRGRDRLGFSAQLKGYTHVAAGALDERLISLAAS
jgi:hypothetical protein